MTEEEEEQELREAIARVREATAACIALVDELFPEDERKPESRTSTVYYDMQSQTRGG